MTDIFEMSDVEDVTFLPGAGNSHKKVLYEPEGMDRCKQYVCTQKRAFIVVFSVMVFILLVALIAALARPIYNGCEVKNDKKYHSEETAKVCAPVNGKEFPWHDIRLPKNVYPLSYKLTMHPNITTFTFSGSVDIVITSKEDTDFIVLHSKNLKNTYTLTETNTNENIDITEVLECTLYQQSYLKLDHELKQGVNYTLQVDFTANLSTDLAGFYKSSYLDDAGKQVWLATTHFEPTDARRAFPCFDEPQMKAVFSMKMVREKRHISLFNTQKVNTVQRSDGLEEDVYGASVKMSTYLVAFVVCDYKNLTDTTRSNVRVSVFAPPNLIQQAEYSLQVAVSVLDYYEDFFGIKYPMPKQDLIAIPDFAAGAMENWGLITYRMTALLYDKAVSSASNKQWVAIVVAHELAHQWFGNLVTMEWWNDLWLNEGFASFTEYLGADHKEPGWDMLDQFIVVNLLAALHSDSLSSSHPISVDVSDPSEISELFDHISYEKGACIVRMLESFVTMDVLKASLRLYLNRHKYSNAETSDLWQAVSEAAKSRNLSIDVKKVMDTWTLQMGYPVVKVTRNGNQISATQERFLLNPRGTLSKEFTSPFDYTWQVPLTYITDKNTGTPVMNWMKQEPVSFTVPAGAKWVKFNVGMKGFYRVHYQQSEWQNLIYQLYADHSVFSIGDRASLLDDAFSLAQAGYMDVVTALDLTIYLLKETEYVPWNVAIENLQYIGAMLQERPSYEYYKKYVKHLIEKMVLSLGWKDEGPQLQLYLRAFMLSTAVRLDHEPSVNQSLRMYREWMAGKAIPVNLKNVVYHAGVQFGGDKEWEFAWQAYKNTTVPSEKRKLMYALAATTDALRLNRYLYLSLDEKEIRKGDTIVVISHIASNPAGRVLAWRFVKQHWKQFSNRYGKGSFDMPTLILRTTSKFTTQYDYDEVKSFYEKHDTGSGLRAVSQALESIQMNVDWLNRNEKKCVDWLKDVTQKIDNGQNLFCKFPALCKV